jgi:copper ion binding protein
LEIFEEIGSFVNTNQIIQTMKKLFILLFAVAFIAACNNANKAGQDENVTETTESVAPEEEIIEVAIIDVTGMHCDACVKTVTKALTEIEGVNDAKVSLEYEQAKVKFSASKVSEEDFKAAIEGKGYGVGNIEIKKIEDQTAQPAK